MRELPFAGHPTVGTAVLLARLDGGADARAIVLEEEIGPITCQVAMNDADCGRARFELASEPVEAGEIHDAATIAAALSLTLDDLGNDDFVPCVWSAGMPFTFVPLHGLDAVARSAPDPVRWDKAFGPEDPPGVYVFTAETSNAAHDFHVRMFAPRLGVPEDPATGAAAAAFAGVLARYGGLADGTHELKIEQGHEMKRPSLIELSLTLRGGILAGAAIGGEAIVVTEGMIIA
jgi:trans-2,3-dihydro-3-hydroxyanthranilate isomerase